MNTSNDDFVTFEDGNPTGDTVGDLYNDADHYDGSSDDDGTDGGLSDSDDSDTASTTDSQSNNAIITAYRL